MTTPGVVKQVLLTIKEPKEEFTVDFSGKSDKKVNGYYRPSTREIVINDRNFESENQLVFTVRPPCHNERARVKVL